MPELSRGCLPQVMIKAVTGMRGQSSNYEMDGFFNIIAVGSAWCCDYVCLP